MEATIKLSKGNLPFVSFKAGDKEREFEMNHDDLVQFLKEACYKEVVKTQVKPNWITPTLPMNTVRYSLQSDGSELISIVQPEMKSDVQFMDTEYKNTPIPSLLMTFRIKNKRMLGGYMFAYKGNVMQDDTKLYRFPFSNVHADSGALCYYNNGEEYHTLEQLGRWFHSWMKIPFNNHMYDAYTDKYPRTTKNIPLRELFSYLSKQEMFPYDILIEQMTFKEFIEKVYGKENK